MSETEEHGVAVVMTSRIEFVAQKAGDNGGPPRNKPIGAAQWQGGGVITPEAWRSAKDDPAKAALVQSVLAHIVANLPKALLDGFATVGQKTYEGEEPSRIIQPAQGMQPGKPQVLNLKKNRPS